MIPHHEALFNPKKSASTGNVPDMAALRAVWRSLSREAAKSPGLAEGIARRRSDLLASIEPWRIPEVLDALNKE